MAIASAMRPTDLLGTAEHPMYAVFDRFLSVASWPKRQATDEQRFFEALGQVVKNPNFNPVAMGQYFNSKSVAAHTSEGPRLRSAIDYYVSDAKSIQRYLAHIAALYPE